MYIKKIFKFSLPMIVANLIMAMNGFVAMWILSRLGPGGVAAGALTSNTFGVMASLVFAFSVPVSIFAARAYGSKQHSDIPGILQAGCVVVIALGLVVALGLTQLNHVYAFFHQPPAASNIAAAFFKGYAFALIPFGLQLVLAQVINGTSKPQVATLLSFIGLLLTAPISYLLAVGGMGIPAMGAFGVGLGGAIGNLLLLSITTCYLAYSRSFRKMKLFHFKKAALWKWIKYVFSMGVPVSAQRVGEVTAMFAITIFIGHLGQMALASYQVSLQFSFIVLMIGFGFTQASGIIVGQSLGQGRPRDAIKEALTAIKIAFLAALACSSIFIFFPHHLVHVFIGKQVPHIKQITTLAVSLLAIAAFSQLFDIIRNVATGALRGYRDTQVPMYIGFISCWVIGVPLAYVLGFIAHWGTRGAVIGFTAGLTTGALLTVLRLIHQQRKSLNLHTSSEDVAAPTLDR